jgi:signal peptidase I
MNPTADTGATEFLANLSVGTIAAIALALTIIRLVLLKFASPATPGKSVDASSMARSVAEIIESLIIAAVLVFLIIRPFFVQAFYIPSQSMEPTLLGHNIGEKDGESSDPHTDTVHDHIFVNKLVFRTGDPAFGDIVVFRAPKEADSEDKMLGLPQKENVLIKRVIGLPGDTIELKEGTINWHGEQRPASIVYRDGKPLTEPYIKEPIDLHQPDGAINGVGKPFKLGPTQYFVMGDNRNDSNDSRFWGPLERNRVIGKAQLIFWPLNRIQVLKLP